MYSNSVVNEYVPCNSKLKLVLLIETLNYICLQSYGDVRVGE